MKVAGSSRRLLTYRSHRPPIIQASLQVGQCKLAEGAARESHESVAALPAAKSQLGAPEETGVWNILDHPL